MKTRKHMISFIAMCEDRPIGEVEVFFHDKRDEQIVPIYDKMKTSRDEIILRKERFWRDK